MSFWSMVLVTLGVWTRWSLMAMGLDFAEADLPMLNGAMLLVGAVLIITSHLLIFVCDHLSGGEAPLAAWALVVFWVGLPVGGMLAGLVELLVS
ncbi:hypothetical protein [Roseibacillus ishigakijimensis]|uniref:Uncharacterized protein n=1 Tax=Roseibacillus ishigakijimensis TaxID=454146 RepID=A0A934RJY6_9BACT|nr:hypothetical protein [Roseibacillus ishigakijimensis]